MQGGLVRLAWGVDARGYDLVERKARGGSSILTEVPAGTYIAPRGVKTYRDEIDLGRTEVLTDLANASTPELALVFATKWGLLYHSHEKGHDAATGYGEFLLDEFLAISKEFRDSLTAPGHTEKKRLLHRPKSKDPDLYRIFCGLYGEAGAEFKFGIEDADFGLVRWTWSDEGLVIRPLSLRQFCWLQRLQQLAGAAEVLRCGVCGTLFAYNRSQMGRPKTYCSDACKSRRWRENHKRRSAKGKNAGKHT